MKSKMFFIYLILTSLIINACREHKEKATFFAEIKKLESVRDSEAVQWRALFDKAGNLQERRQVVQAAGYTRSSKLLSFYFDLFKNETDDSLKKLALFGIGQTSHPEAEQLLLKIEPDSLSVPLRQAFFAALSHCCSEKALAFFKKGTERFYSDEIFIRNLALCINKLRSSAEFIPAIIDTSKAGPVSVAQAYFLARAAAFSDIPLLIGKLSAARGLSKKYLFKGLYRKASNDSAKFKKILEKDSSSFLKLHSEIHKELKTGKNWRQSYYALKLSAFVADSSFSGLYRRYLNGDLIHTQVEAWKAYAALEPDVFSAELVSALAKHKKNYYLRSELLKILSRYKPDLAYSLIMKELSDGDSYSKSGLLLGLAATKLPRAFTTIRQFLNVPDTYLLNTAFQCLSASKRLSVSEINKALHSSEVSSVSAALDRYQSSSKMPGENLLFEIYKKFNTVSGVEIQKAVLSHLKKRAIRLDSARQSILLDFAAHPVIQRQLIEDFNLIREGNSSLQSTLPSYLQADSLILYSKNPVLKMFTSKGIIRLELFPELAPFTVQNFIHLSQSGFYNQLFFHRVIADFVIQGGDPHGDGWGGPDYLIPSEDNSAPFRRGSIGMASAGFDTGGSQFFICQSEQPHLTGNYTLFGAVISGMDVVDKIVPGDKILKIEPDIKE